MSADSPFDIQNKILQNSDELQNYLRDLKNWEKDMKKKEKELSILQISEDQDFPPIRNSISKSKKKTKPKKHINKPVPAKTDPIKCFDYQAWEKFDVDLELKKLDEDKKESSGSDSSSSEEIIALQRKQEAILKKDKGNCFFKKGNYDSAISTYTTGMALDPENCLLPANRAMAFLKKEQFQAAENDCTMCLSMDPTYVKAYLRRGMARVSLQKLLLAKEDFSKALELEPDNKQAQMEIEKLIKKSFTEVPVSHLSDIQFMENVKRKFLGNAAEDKTNENQSSRNEENALLDIKSMVETLKQSLPPVPGASFQFLTDWKMMSNYPELKYKYLKQFPPEKFPVLFKHSMEADIFPEVVHILSTFFLDNGDDVFNYIKYLSSVGRFKTMLMFLSNEEIKDLERLLNHIKTLNYPSCEVEDLLKQYQV